MTKKQFGSINTLSCNLLNMKVENLTLKEINMFVGENGSGKSFLLIMMWCCSLLVNAYFNNKDIEACKKILKFILDNSYSDTDQFTGLVKAVFEDMTIEFELDKGEIKYLNIVITNTNDELEAPGIPVYMSTNTRLYTNIVQYVKTKKLMGLTKTLDFKDFTGFQKVCAIYKLYDVLFMERILFKFSNPFYVIPEQAKNALKEMSEIDITNIFYDDEKEDILITIEEKDGTKKSKSVTKLSAGEQAMLNMLTAVS